MTSLRVNFFTIAVMGVITVYAQQPNLDSLRQQHSATQNDTMILVLSGRLAREYKEINPDTAYHYAKIMLDVAVKLNLRMEEAVAMGELGYSLLNQGNYPRSLQDLLKAIAIAEDPAIEENILPDNVPLYDEFTDRHLPAHLQRMAVLSKVKQYAAILYSNSLNYKKALSYSRAAVTLAKESTNLPLLAINYITLGRTYMHLNQQDSALLNLQSGYDCAIRAGDKRYLGSILLNMGRVYLNMNNRETAKSYFKKALVESNDNFYFRGVVASDLALADLYKSSGQIDSSQYHIRHGLRVANYLNAPDLSLRCYTALVDIYKGTSIDSTVKYQSLIIRINNETFNAKQAQQFQNIDFDEQQRLNELETTRKEFQSKLRTNILLGSTFTLVVIAFFLYRNSRTKQKAKQKVEEAYHQLKATQSQLIQSEKMASLGELTAGIAHEIQNPLNFVNNFSEVNKELLGEMSQEIEKGNLDEAKILARAVMENCEKVSHHGKRADAIVKGMLQHSRKSSGLKEPTDINELCDEYLRLAFHGLRAKDKSFNAKFETNLDPTLPKINVVPQDIGRVVLNLINNAFYAVSEKAKEGIAGYEPTVRVSTSLSPGEGRGEARIQITVSDNGTGIPDHIKDKIFQPFFTTKPTGQGTGLGLSLSYDIVKSHGGLLTIHSDSAIGATIKIELPR
jgi:signal transduction histidine kinase